MFKSKEEKLLKSGLKPLKKYGFKYKRTSVTKSAVSGTFYSVEYESTRTRRSVSVRYFPRHGEVVSSIGDMDNYFDFSDSGSLSINDIKFDQFEGANIEKLDRFLGELVIILTSKYLKILCGAPFQNDKFDWSPYK